MIDERSFDLCRYYGEDRSVFIDGKREKGHLYLLIHVVDTFDKTSKYQTIILPKETMKCLCKSKGLSWFVEEFYGINGLIKLLEICNENRLIYHTFEGTINEKIIVDK